MSNGKIEVKHLTVEYRNSNPYLAVDDVSFSVEPGEFVSLMGPSGCGKTTTLHAITGFIKPAKGKIMVDGKPLNYPPKDVQIMFQQPHLFHWKTVYGNLEFYMKINDSLQSLNP